MNWHFEDMSAQMFGKYQYTSQHTDGLMYADVDFKSNGKLKRGALPDLHQRTPEKCAQAKRMHDRASMSIWKRLWAWAS